MRAREVRLFASCVHQVTQWRDVCHQDGQQRACQTLARRVVNRIAGQRFEYIGGIVRECTGEVMGECFDVVAHF
ncbi:hypothetical protein DF143_23640 [Burkholderia cenocepacia]|nr:hypothetical protein DF143_23640 [Burkholderia cenocepacia]